MAGTDDSQVTRSRQLIRLTSGSTLELLKSRKILISFDLASLLLENKINLVFAGCRASLRDLKKSEIFLNFRLTLAMSESRSGSDNNKVVSSANRRARSSEQRGKSLI